MQALVDVYHNFEPYRFEEVGTIATSWFPHRLVARESSGLYLFFLEGVNNLGLKESYKSFCLDTAPTLVELEEISSVKDVNHDNPKNREIALQGLNALRQTLTFINSSAFHSIEPQILKRQELSLELTPAQKQQSFCILKQKSNAIALLDMSGNVLSIRHQFSSQDLDLIDYKCLQRLLQKSVSTFKGPMQEELKSDVFDLLTLGTTMANDLLKAKILILEERENLSLALPQLSVNPAPNQKI